MEDKKLYIKKIREDIYLLDEAHEATGYLVVGEDKALLIDTMMGYNDLAKAVRDITDKPVMVVNTHGHGDHIFGNIYFEEAYMNPEDTDLARSFIEQEEFITFCKEKGRSMPPFKDIRGGDVIDLGGKTIEVYDIPGHTKGSILLLLKEDRVLFAGDSINHHLWLMLDGCPSVSAFRDTLKGLMFLQDKADILLHGHAGSEDDICLMSCFLRGLEEICEGDTREDLPYEWFGGVSNIHHFKVLPGRRYSSDDHAICYGNI